MITDTPPPTYYRFQFFTATTFALAILSDLITSSIRITLGNMEIPIVSVSLLLLAIALAGYSWFKIKQREERQRRRAATTR